MNKPIVYGDPISTYVRTVRLALEEKGVAHTLETVDLVKGQHAEAAHLARNPWGKMPAFEHDGGVFYETSAIVRYIDQVFPEPPLMPATGRARVPVNQVMSIVDSFGYPASITNIFIPRVLVPSLGGETDEAQVKEALPKAELFLKELGRLLDTASYFGGDDVSLADLYVLPVLTYLQAVPEGKAMIEATPNVAAWMARMNERDSVKAVMPA